MRRRKVREGRNLTPMRALDYLRDLDQLTEATRNLWAIQRIHDALYEHVKCGLSR